jgi:oxygen-independent coproporphyrinogen-3 oxidase
VSSLVVSPQLLEKYRTSAPRYTSYPTAVDWSAETFDPGRYPQHLAREAARDGPLSVYVHLPFCVEMCLYCGCNVVITRKDERVERYLERLETEFARVSRSGIGRRPVHQYHWGGGTPTHLDVAQMQRVQAAFTSAFELAPGAEVAIEVDPRVTSTEQVEALAEMGFNRISLGVQDFDHDVQVAVKRVQSEKLTRRLIEDARKNRIGSVNVDLIYGLPLQTRASFARTVQTMLDIRPNRIALFHYAHVPWLKKHQTALDMGAAPDPAEKLAIFIGALEAFLDAGYVYLGLDHFALPDDELARALENETLDRNFMGYTTRRGDAMVSLGVSSIGEVDGCFVQNHHSEGAYLAALEEGGLAAMRGHALSADDRLRRDVILGLMCNGVLHKSAIERAHGVEFDAAFSAELAALAPLEDDGLVLLDPDALRLTPLGQLFMRNVALPFDRYYAARQARGESGGGTFSKTL